MSLRSTLKSKIEHLIETKNNYNNALKDIESLRNKKNELEQEINEIMRNLNMDGKIIIVNNQKIAQKQVTISQSLTLKYIETTLEQYNSAKHSNKLDTKELLNYIRMNRQKYTKNEIKIN